MLVILNIVAIINESCDITKNSSALPSPVCGSTADISLLIKKGGMCTFQN